MKIHEVIEITHIGKRKGKNHPDDPSTEKELIALGGIHLATMPDGHKIYLEKSKTEWGAANNWNSYYAVSPEGKVDLALGAEEKNNVLTDLSLYAINKNNTLKAHNFYAFLITKLGKSLVASEQSPGGHAVWKQLQKYHKNISIHGWLNGKAVNVDMRDPEYTHDTDEYAGEFSKEIQDARKMELVATKKTGVSESVIDEVYELGHVSKAKGAWGGEERTEKELIVRDFKLVGTLPSGHKIYKEESWRNYVNFAAVNPVTKRVEIYLEAQKTGNTGKMLSGLRLRALTRKNTLKAHDFYAFLITKLGYSLVADEQSPGGHAVWEQLQKYHKNVSIHGWLNNKPVNVDMRDPEYTHGKKIDWWDEEESEELEDAANMKLIATKRTTPKPKPKPAPNI